jgi:hypothetical protein
MKLGAGAWIGIIIGGIGGLIGMTVAIMASPMFGSVFALIFIVIFGGVFWSFFFKPMMVRNKLSKTGVPAQARILSLSDTGVTINMNPQIKLLLEVTPPMGAPYQVEMKQVISRLQVSEYQPGTVLPVIVDPNDKNLIEINYDGGAQSSGYSAGGVAQATDKVMTGPWAGMSREESNALIKSANDANIKLASYGQETKAIVTKYTWLGIYVNGENPYAEIEVEVLPMSGSPFKGKTQALINAASVQKYQPGAEIYVKYDPNDTSKVVITHS